MTKLVSQIVGQVDCECLIGAHTAPGIVRQFCLPYTIISHAPDTYSGKRQKHTALAQFLSSANIVPKATSDHLAQPGHCRQSPRNCHLSFDFQSSSIVPGGCSLLLLRTNIPKHVQLAWLEEISRGKFVPLSGCSQQM